MAYQRKSEVLEKLDPTQLKIYTHLPEGIPLGKAVKVKILDAEKDDTRLFIRFQDSFGHQVKQQHFLSNRDGNGASFAIRQLLSSITHSSQMFKHLMSLDDLTQVLIDTEIKTQYELGTGIYIVSYMNNFRLINENYELQNDIQYTTVSEARQAMLMLGFKEGWAQITGYTPINSTTQMTNTVRIETLLGDDYAIDSDTFNVFGSSGTDTQDSNKTQSNNRTHQVERDGYRKVSSSLPESKRF